MTQLIVRELWGNRQCSWISLDAEGSSAGILLCWNSRLYTIKDNFKGAFSVLSVLENKDPCSSWIISSVYGPTDRILCSSFWYELDSIHSIWAGPWHLGGDWNITRFTSEKSRGGNTIADMEAFSDWITSQSLIDLHLRGTNFTWSNH